MPDFTIGKLAKSTKLNIETIRFYERNRLLPVPRRSPAGYRLYTDEDVNRLYFIALAKRHGFSLKEIRELLELKVDPSTTCGDIRKKAEVKIQIIDEKIHELKKIKKALAALVKTCYGSGPKSDCPILDAFEKK